MEKEVYIIHGFQGKPNDGWKPWLKEELEKKGYKVSIPTMPNADKPQMREWIEFIRNLVGTPNPNTFFVGHSLGAIAILRYLESLESNQKIGGAILLAGFATRLDNPLLDNFFTTPIDWEKIKTHTTNFVAIHSDNDPHVGLEYADIFKEKLGAKLIVEHNMGHFSSGEGTTKTPSLLEELLRISR